MIFEIGPNKKYSGNCPWGRMEQACRCTGIDIPRLKALQQ